MKKTLALLLALLMCVGMMAGCAKEETPDVPDKPDAGGEVKPEPEKKPEKPAEPFTYYWIRSGEETTVNPHLANVSNDANVVGKIGATLYRYIPNGDGTTSLLVPDLAAALPETKDGGVTWTIKIDPNAKWANGEKIDAHTFEYSMKMQLDPTMLNPTGGTAGNYFMMIKNAPEYFAQGTSGSVKWEDVGFKAIDDETLEVVGPMKQTSIDVMRHFSRAVSTPVYQPLYEKYMTAEKDKTTYGSDLSKVMCSGPFKMDSWIKGSEIIFSKNENYLHADEIHIDKVYSRMVKDEATRMELFEKGECDYLLLGSTGMAKYGEDPRMHTYPKISIETVEFNHNHPKRPWLADPLFKKAIFYAMDRAAIAKATGAEPAPYFLCTTGQILSDGTKYRDYPAAKAIVPENDGFNPDLARKYMDECMKKYGLDKISVNLLYTEGTDYRRLSSEYLQSSLPKIFGEDKFEMTLTANAYSLLNKTMRESVAGPTEKWDLCWSSWGLSAEPFSPWKKVERYTTWYPRRYTNYKSTEVDRLVELCKTDEYRLDEHKLADLTVEMEKAMYEEMVCAPCFCVNQNVLYSTRLDLPMKQYDNNVGFGWEFAKLK